VCCLDAALKSLFGEIFQFLKRRSLCRMAVFPYHLPLPFAELLHFSSPPLLNVGRGYCVQELILSSVRSILHASVVAALAAFFLRIDSSPTELSSPGP